MNRIAALLIAACPSLLGAHPCPYIWNIGFEEATEIKGESVVDFVAKFNEAVKKETGGMIERAILLDWKPDTFTKVPENSPYSRQMDELIQRYAKITDPLIKQGVPEYGTVPKVASFPAKIPVACMLSAEFAGARYDETKEGARVARERAALECRAYELSGKFLEKVREWQREDRIPANVEPAAYLFARFSGMTWMFFSPDPADGYKEVPIVEAVTLYLPEQKVMLAIETKEKHEEMAKVLLEGW